MQLRPADAVPAAIPAVNKKSWVGIFIPSGKTHDLISFGVLLSISFFILGRFSKFETALFAGGFLLSFFLFSPDLDTRSASYRRWGVLRFFWLPYLFLFRHRGLSHNPVIGPLSRLLYVGVPLYLIAGFLEFAPPVLSNESALFFLLGFWVPAVVHWAVDRI
jgi:uncharacterized metal-binding protein